MSKIYRVKEDVLIALANKCREYGGATKKLTFPRDFEFSIEMSYEKGKKAEHDAFWDIFQNNGGEMNYYYAFAYNRFTDENYYPIHDIVCQSGTNTASQYMFNAATELTDTKVAIYANGNSLSYAFNVCTKLHTIRKLVVHKNLSYSNAFRGCEALANIVIEGEIGKSISFNDSPLLTDESTDSITEHLIDLSGGTSQTLTVHSDVYNRMVADGKDALVTAKNWALAKG